MIQIKNNLPYIPVFQDMPYTQKNAMIWSFYLVYIVNFHLLRTKFSYEDYDHVQFGIGGLPTLSFIRGILDDVIEVRRICTHLQQVSSGEGFVWFYVHGHIQAALHIFEGEFYILWKKKLLYNSWFFHKNI